MAKNACKHAEIITKFSDEIQDFANAFVTLQEKRHDADYDPFAKFTKSEVLADIELADAAIKKISSATASDARAFAIHVLFKNR